MMKYIALLILTISLLLFLVSCGSDNIVIHAHSYGSWQIEIQPTCTEKGTLKRTCTCGYTEQTTVSPLSHSYSDKIIISEPTCTERGLAKYRCNLCGDLKDTILDKTSHRQSSEYVIEDSYHAKECTECHSVIGKEDHYFVNGACVICDCPDPGQSLSD